MDARISNTHGKSVWLAQLWGKPTVMFYEDKDSTSQNQALKDELFKQGKERGLLDSVSVIAIANVRGFDWFPAKNFVVGAVKDAQKRSGLPVYLDWSGRLSSKPWSLSATGSTVMVIDASPPGRSLTASSAPRARTVVTRPRRPRRANTTHSSAPRAG